MFEQLVSTEEKHLNELVRAKGGVKALRNDKELLFLEKRASKASSAPSSEGHRVTRERHGDANPNANDLNDLRKDILEEPDVDVKKNENVHSHKFEAQKRQIIDELTFVIKREGDRVIQEMKGGPHERIRDCVCVFYPSLKLVLISRRSQTIHEIWTEMVDIILSYETLDIDESLGLARCLLSETITLRSSPRKLKASLAWVLLRLIAPGTRMRGQSSSSMSRVCSLF